MVMRDGSLRMVILASALNFDLKSPQEQDSIEFAYQGFLNGLHFPIQIVVRSRKLDLDGYLENFEILQANEENPLIAGLMEDYIYNVRGLLDQVNIMNKEFYVVVPYYVEAVTKKKDNAGFKLASLFKGNTDEVQTTALFEQRKRDLIQRANLVASGLAQLGIRAAVLSTQEVSDLFYTAYNQEEASSQPLTDISQLTTPVTERGNEAPAQYPTGVGLAPEAPPLDLYAAAQQGVAMAQPPAGNVPQPQPNYPQTNPLIGGPQ